MHFYELIQKQTKNKKTRIYVDMDGVIASYDIGKPYDFENKRPLTTNIKTLSKINNLENTELFILSICKKDSQIKEKNNWLDKYAPFFQKDNRIIISKESNPNLSSKELKLDYLKSLKTDNQIILIDDDNEIIKTIKDNAKNIILYQDSELTD